MGLYLHHRISDTVDKVTPKPMSLLQGFVVAEIRMWIIFEYFSPSGKSAVLFSADDGKNVGRGATH
jgi:hypothetical protein